MADAGLQAGAASWGGARFLSGKGRSGRDGGDDMEGCAGLHIATHTLSSLSDPS